MFDANSRSDERFGWARSGTSTTLLNCAPTFLAIPSLQDIVPAHILSYGDTKTLANTINLAQKAGWFNLKQLPATAGLSAVIDQILTAIKTKLTVEQHSRLSFNFSLEDPAALLGLDAPAAGAECYHRSKHRVSETKPAIALQFQPVAQDSQGAMLYLKDSLAIWRSKHHAAEIYIAQVMMGMNAAPWVWTPFDIQTVWSEYYFECFDEHLEEDEDGNHGTTSLYNPKQAETIPQLWRTHREDGPAEAVQSTLALPRASTYDILVDLMASTDPCIRALVECGERIRRLAPAVPFDHLRYYASNAPDDIVYAVAYEKDDFLTHHFDMAYQDVLNSGDYPPAALVSIVEPTPARFDVLAKDLCALMIYIDACAAFVEMVTDKEPI